MTVHERARQVVAAAVRCGATLATCESLTGGLLGATLTSVPGSSVAYRGGLITYATDLKASLAGVDADRLARDGAVSASTAEQMACGVAARCGADHAVALTGVAGPDPQEGHPAGTVFLGWSAPSGPGVQRLELAGDRAAIRDQAVLAALTRLLGLIEDDGE